MAAIAIELLIGVAGLILTALFTPKPKPQYGSRLQQLNVQSVSPGNPVPRVWGTMKIPATLIYASPLIETMHTHEASGNGKSGGKGGGGNKAITYTYTYSVDLAAAVCLGPVYRLNRVWSNQKLLYIDPTIASQNQGSFDAAYQSEATRLIDEENLDKNTAAASAFVFAWNNYSTSEITLTSPSDAVSYITSHPIDDTAGITGSILYPDSGTVTTLITQLYSSLNNQEIYLANINRFDELELYTGSSDQAPNGLLQGWLGLDNVPRYLDLAYIVVTNLQLMDYGNTVPTFNVEVQESSSGTTDLTTVLTTICLQAGLAPDQFDAVSYMDYTPFPGFCVMGNQSPREAIVELQKCFPFSAVESGNKIVFRSVNARPTQILNPKDFGAHATTEELPPSVETTIMSDFDLPQRINFAYQEPERNFSANTLYAARYNTLSTSIEENSVTIALHRNDAQTAIQNYMYYRMLAKHSYTWKLPKKYITLEPTDIFLVPDAVVPSRYNQYYATEVNLGANGVIELKAVDHAYINPDLKPVDTLSTDLSASNSGEPTLPQTSQTIAFMFDCPLLFDTDTDSPGFYAVLVGSFANWAGGVLYVDIASSAQANAYGKSWTNSSAGSQWIAVVGGQANVPFGVCLGTLAPGMHSCYWDRQSSILVRVSNGSPLQSADENDMLSQSLNATFIGQEIVAYSTVAEIGNGLYMLTNFLRGLRGTERYMDTHVAGENFVRLSGDVPRISTTKAELNITDNFRSISQSQDVSTALSYTFTDTGNSLRPYTPYVYQKFRDASTGDITVSWWPRVRQNGQWLSGGDVTIPANDTPETYSVDICTAAHPSTAVATYSVTGALGGTLTYSASQQTTDLGGLANPVYMVIYQISQIVGRGFGIGISF